MEVLVLDTNIVSYMMRGDAKVELYRRHFEGKTLAISFISVRELYEGAFRREWSEKKLGRLKEQIKSYLVIPFPPLACETWGGIRAQRKDQPIAVDDAWIAATAIAHDCPLVTHDPADFVMISKLRIVTEQTSQRE